MIDSHASPRDCFKMLHGLKTAATNPSICSNRHSTDADSYAGAIRTRLRKCRADGPSNLSAASGSVRAECCWTIDLPAAQLRSHSPTLWWTVIGSELWIVSNLKLLCLSTRNYVDKHRTILDCLLVSPIYLGDLHSVLLVPTVCTCHISDCLLSAAGPSRSPDFKSGTIYLNTVTSADSLTFCSRLKRT